MTLYLVPDPPNTPAAGVQTEAPTDMGGAMPINGWKLDQTRDGLMPSTATRRSDMMSLFSEWCDGAIFDQTADDIQEFLDSRRTPRGPIVARTRYTYVSCLDCFYRWAIREGLTTTNPAAEINRPKLRKTLPRPASDSELAFALAGSTGQIHAWITLAAYAGLRCAEIAHLHRDDVLHDLGMLRVLGKGGKERLVPLHPLVIDALSRQPRPRANTHIFRRSTNQSPWNPSCVSQVGNQFLRDLGIELTMHQFRHWFGTRALRACKDLRVVQELMGHASPTTTAIYTAFCDEDGRAAVLGLPVATPPTIAEGVAA